MKVNLIKLEEHQDVITINTPGLYELYFPKQQYLNKTLKINIDASNISLHTIGIHPEIKWSFKPNIKIFLERNMIIYNDEYSLNTKLPKNVEINDLCIFLNPVNQIIFIVAELGLNSIYTANCFAQNNIDISKIINIDISHLKNDSKSLIKTISLADDFAKTTINAKTIIEEKAHNCVVNQDLLFILLSKGAISQGIPLIDAKNNQLKAKHSCYIGNLDEIKKYYLQTRGLNSKLTNQLIYKSTIKSIFLRPINKDIMKLYEKSIFKCE